MESSIFTIRNYHSWALMSSHHKLHTYVFIDDIFDKDQRITIKVQCEDEDKENRKTMRKYVEQETIDI